MHEMRSRVAEILGITITCTVLSSTYMDYYYITIDIVELSICTIVVVLVISNIIHVLYKYNLV